MVLVHKNMWISTLEDIQKLKVKDLREILSSNSETAGGMKADLVLKVYAIFMRNMLWSAKNLQQNADDGAENHQDTAENEGKFKYDEVLRRISALGWSTDLRQLPELNFIQLYNYLVVSTRKYRHIVLKGTNYKKLKSYQFFFEGNLKRLETKTHENRTYVKASVLPCLVPRPQYYTSVISFGSRGLRRKVWPRQKSEKWDNLSHFFTMPISSRRREFSEHFWERDRKRKALQTPRFWFNVYWSS